MAEAKDIADGDIVEVQGSGSARYQLRNLGGVYSCSCPAWRNQSAPIERRSCKHLRAYRGDAVENARLGDPDAPPPSPRKPTRAARPRPAATPADAAAADAAPAVEDVVPPPLLLAHSWDQQQDLAGWWMSEKLDGVRAFWDGQRFISRLGNLYLAPEWFTAGLPEIALDGELWGGRKKFQRTISIVRRQDRSKEWRDVRYVVFDAPQHPGPFEERLAVARAVLEARRPELASVLEQTPCRDLDHLRAELARVEALGGEGLMMRRPASRYDVGRSATLLKVKSFFDAEARVIGHQPGAGKHTGRLGALLVEMPDGTQFAVGTGLSDAERRDPPPIGSVITYRYQELSDGGVPRFPSYLAVRTDLPWPPKA